MPDLADRMDVAPETAARPATLAELRQVYDEDAIAAMLANGLLGRKAAAEFTASLPTPPAFT